MVMWWIIYVLIGIALFVVTMVVKAERLCLLDFIANMVMFAILWPVFFLYAIVTEYIEEKSK